MKKHFFSIFCLLVLLMSLLSSCSLQKYIPKQSLVIVKNRLQIDSRNYPQLSVAEITPYIQPKVNKKFLFTRLSLWAYYSYKAHPTKVNKIFNKSIGADPAYFFRDDAERNVKKIAKYLNDFGFFYSKITYDVNTKGKFVKVNYHIFPAEPYRYDSIYYHYQDTALRYYINRNRTASLLKKNDIYNAYTLDAERDRITADLRNNGYYYFNRNYIQFVVDTNQSDNRMHLLVDIKAREVPDVEHPGKMSLLPHTRYFIRNVLVIPDYKPLWHGPTDTISHVIYFRGDTTAYHYKFICQHKQRFNLLTFNNAITIKPNRAYSDGAVQKTYQNLVNYPVLGFVNIAFDSLNSSITSKPDSSFLNATIQMQTRQLNNVSLEAMGTNSSGDLGVNGALSFTNRNVFRRAEVLRLRLMGGFEAQHLGALSSDSAVVVPVNSSGLFNTFEAGVDATVFFPMTLFPFRNIRLLGRPHTNVGLGYNYQRRPYYSRSITNVDIGYSWDQNKQIKHVVTPLNINFVKVNPSLLFQGILESQTNRSLKEQYSNHFIVGLKYSFIFNDQQSYHIGNFNYLRFDLESSGNLLNGINKMIGSKITAQNYYSIFGVRYSQFVRMSYDYRHYVYFDKEGTALVFRSLLGLAIPYGNSNDIPYEKGFYAGGANGMRGWRFRMLGPGAFRAQDAYERIGEIQLEGNIEFRFPVYKFIKSAFFIDAGNIWNYNQTDTYPGGQFRWDNFASEIAIDAGFGIRFDFSYFVFRLDAAVPVRNPAFPVSERWRISQLSWQNIVGNFGIGYPF